MKKNKKEAVMYMLTKNLSEYIYYINALSSKKLA